MHGQHLDTLFNGQSPSLNTGKVLFEGDMPPDTPPQHCLADRMSRSGTSSNFAFEDEDSSTQDQLYGPGDAKRKKGNGIAGKSIEEELCRICGDRASGYHYNALSCEGCKGFFRRSITRSAIYKCKYGGNCEMDMWMRRKCQYCRLRRCREVGMKEECLLSEKQCIARNARRKSKQRHPSEKKADLSPDSVSPQSEIDVKPDIKSVTSNMPGTSVVYDDPIEKLNDEQRRIVNNLVCLQEKYEFPEEEDLQKETVIEASQSETTPDAMLNQMARITVLITHLIVEFAKNLPEFSSLDKEDQIVLLKAASTEVIALRAARCYDINTKCIVFANGIPCSLQNMLDTGMGKYAELVYQFCDCMAQMKTDNAEYALLTAICIFSERPGLKDKKKIEDIQILYVEVLQHYENAKRLRGGNALATFLTRLMDLRSISAEHSNLILDMEMEGRHLPEIIQEVYVIPPEGT